MRSSSCRPTRLIMSEYVILKSKLVYVLYGRWMQLPSPNPPTKMKSLGTHLGVYCLISFNLYFVRTTLTHRLLIAWLSYEPQSLVKKSRGCWELQTCLFCPQVNPRGVQPERYPTMRGVILGLLPVPSTRNRGV